MKKIVVILAQPIEENTSSAIRVSSILRELPFCGYQTICYSPYANNVDSSNLNLFNIEIRRYGEENYVKKIKERLEKEGDLRTKTLNFIYKLYKKIDIFGASLIYLKYTKKIMKEIKNEHPDILLTFSDPITAHIIGCKCKKYASKYIQQWGDPLASDIIAKVGLPIWIRKIIEKMIIKNADRICYVSPLTYIEQKNIYKKYADRMIFLPTPSLNYENTSPNKHKKLKIGYFGNYHSIARNITPLYEAATINLDVELYLIGNSDLHLEKEENIIIIDRMSQEKLEEYLYEMDILVCIMNHKGNQIPGKMYHYAGSYKEIMIIKDGEYGNDIEEYFSKFKHYTFVNNSREEINLVLNKYIRNGIPKRKPVLEFSSEVIAKELLENL